MNITTRPPTDAVSAPERITRRSFLTASLAGVAAATLGVAGSADPVLAGAPDTPPHPLPLPLPPPPTTRLGVASYSLRNFPRDKAIEMVKALGIRYVNLKSMHLPYELSPADLVAARHEVETAGLQI